MHALYPVGSLLLWLRVIGALVVVIGLPGYLLAGRYLAGGRIAQAVGSMSVGLLATALAGHGLDLAGVPLHPWTVAPALAVAGLGLGRWPVWRRTWRRAFAGLRPSTRGESLALVATSVFFLIILVVGFGEFTAPPPVADTENHAFMVRRIAESASMDGDQVLAAPLGSLRVGYLVGWHLSAALVARTGGVAPYAATWLVTLTLLAMMPLALSLLWRALRIPTPLVALGAVWLVTDAFAPAGILGWGGFGQLVGMMLVPVASLLVAAAARDRSLLAAAIAGAALGALVSIHASEVVVALGLGLWLAVRGGTEAAPEGGHRRPAWLTAAVGIGALAVAAGLDAWSLALDYRNDVLPNMIDHRRPFFDALRRFLGSAGGPDPRQAAVVLGLGLGLADRRLRSVALVSLGLGVLYLTLITIGDPVSRLLASPFYGQAPRILYLQIYVLPPLLSLPLVALASPRIRGRWRRPAAIVLGVAALVWFGTGLEKTVSDLRSNRGAVPFLESDYVQACAMAGVVQPDEVVANRQFDGSTWALHVAAAEGIQPQGWSRTLADGTDVQDLVESLAHAPWSAGALQLRDVGVAYLYLSDTVFEKLHRSDLHRVDLDADPRFEPVVIGSTATLYRIHW